jgi:hypothetical protein
MYAWIWRHIPFRQWQLKTLVSLVLVAAISALLWFKVFPLVEPILPFYDGQIENSDTAPSAPEPLPSLSPSR